MATFTLNGYDSYSGCDIVVTARLTTITGAEKAQKEKIYTLGSIQTLSISTHQDKKPVRVIGSANALDYTLGQRTIAGSLVFAVFDKHFATEMFEDLKNMTNKTFLLPDELPALDLTITFANEYGRTSRMAIYGLRIINEGQVMSINDLYTENTYQFVAIAMEPLSKGVTTGNYSGKTSELVIQASLDEEDLLPTTLGEDIYNQNQIENNIISNRVLLTVDVEQPLFEGQEGIAKFYLSPSQNTGIIKIIDLLNNKPIADIDITDSNLKAYSLFLRPGNYGAWYEDKNQTLSNSVTFVINNLGEHINIYDDSPTIDNITENSISIISNNPTHLNCICINNLTQEKLNVPIANKKAKFNDLVPNTSYYIYTENQDSKSNYVKVKTLNVTENFLLGFKNYVKFNNNLLSNDYDKYKEILEQITTNDILYKLSKIDSIEAKELILMAIKYTNEFNTIVNLHKKDYIPQKDINNLYGNSIEFNQGSLKANIFLNKNNKDYFESSQNYPVKVNYQGKTNCLYNTVSVYDNFSKSPKYTFYMFDDNDKGTLNKKYKDINVLNTLLNKDIYNKQHSVLANKCLIVFNNKKADIKLLSAPEYTFNEELEFIFDVDYKDILGLRDKEMFLCISDLDQSLDTTPFRKIRFKDINPDIFASQYVTAIIKDETYCMWIEDENYNIISELALVSWDEEVQDLNNKAFEDKVNKIKKKIELLYGKIEALDNSISNLLSYNNSMKNLYYDLIQFIINSDYKYKSKLIHEIFKIKFDEFNINKTKYDKVLIQDSNLEFNNFDKSQIVVIDFYKDKEKEIKIYNDNNINIQEVGEYKLIYLIDSNPLIKSGFILIDKYKEIQTYNIDMEVK